MSEIGRSAYSLLDEWMSNVEYSCTGIDEGKGIQPCPVVQVKHPGDCACAVSRTFLEVLI